MNSGESLNCLQKTGYKSSHFISNYVWSTLCNGSFSANCCINQHTFHVSIQSIVSTNILDYLEWEFSVEIIKFVFNRKFESGFFVLCIELVCQKTNKDGRKSGSAPYMMYYTYYTYYRICLNSELENIRHQTSKYKTPFY